MKSQKFLWIACLSSIFAFYGCSEGALPSDGLTFGICGDGTLNLDEICDDGNTIDGDGCSADCQTKDQTQDSDNPVCGNGIQEKGEACDDGNTIDDDGCSADCKTASFVNDSVCGNGTPEEGEDCDDGNTIDGDGCSADCQSEQIDDPNPPQTHQCGDGKVTNNEACDDGNTNSNDGCDANCQLEDGWACIDHINAQKCYHIECGNNILETGEDCDAGKSAQNYGFDDNNNRHCTDQCKFAPYCGDGELNDQYGEACDQGSLNGTIPYGDGCTTECLRTPYCGDGIFTRQYIIGEEVFVAEDCDPNDPNSAGGCTQDCKTKEGWNCFPASGVCQEIDDGDDPELPPVYVPECGNDIIDAGLNEECDGATGCSTSCKAKANYKCYSSPKGCTGCDPTNKQCMKIEYGNSSLDPDGYEQCDDGNTTNGDGCTSKGLIETGYVCPNVGKPCVAAACGDGIRAYGEACDDGNTKNNDGCSARCRIEDGATCSTNNIGSKSKCTAGTCGDGKIGHNEQCDGTSGCDACKLTKRDTSKCGNGTINTSNGEECDDGNKLGGDGCSPTCQIESAFECYDNGHETLCKPICGDGITMWMLNGDAAEECDDGNNVSGDGCSAECKAEYGYTCTDFEATPYPDSINLPVTYRDFIGRDKSGSSNGYVNSSSYNLMTNNGNDTSCTRQPTKSTSEKDSNGNFKTTNINKIATGYGHPDFENFAGNLCFGIAKDTLGSDGKPVFSGNINASCCGKLSAAECAAKGTAHNSPQYHTIASHLLCGRSFNTWFRDVSGLNKTVQGSLFMEKSGTDTYVFDSQYPPINSNAKGAGGTLFSKNPAYFTPLTNAGFKDHRTVNSLLCYDSNNSLIDCNKLTEFKKYNIQNTYSGSKWTGNTLATPYTVNGGFTTEIHTYFQYNPAKAGATSSLNFTGDDDVWVFVNNKLFVDLGGMHSRASETGTLTAKNCSNGQLCDETYGVYAGGVYDMHIFQTERAFSGSNFKLTLTGFINSGKSTCAAMCGDGKIAGNEQCDAGTNSNQAAFMGCTTSCQKQSYCGNGKVEEGEQCDSGFKCQESTYKSWCTALGTSYNAAAQCSNSCKFTGSTCGNGVKEGAEECDKTDGVSNGEKCLATCRISRCGDGILDTSVGEECDDGNTNENDSCSSSCQKPRCGDGVVSATEVCDDGINDGAYGHCGLNCTYWAPRCGDGVIQTQYEECDNGEVKNNGAYNGCNANCSLASRCGDNHIDTIYGESCDDGNNRNGDGCSAACITEVN